MNIDFVIHNAEGEILWVGNCPEEDLPLQAGEGQFLIEGKACCVHDSVNPQTGAIIPNGRGTPIQSVQAPQPQAPTLSVEHQLDLLWQAMDSGTFPKAEPFYSAIKSRKDGQ